jgi:hypothetical protein
MNARRSTLWLIAASLGLLGPVPASGFTGEVHTAISKQALKDMGYDDAAAAAVIAGNLNTDRDEGVGGEFWTAAAHFDNEQIAAGSARLKTRLLAALDAVDACDAAQAREQLGRVIHGVQDFFAHSNWVENNGPDAAIDMLALKDPDKDVVCVPGSHKGPLTTGYYFRDKTQAAPAGKCLHDGELQKDDASRPMHAEARARALAETMAMLARFDRAVQAQYGPSARGEANFRLRLLKDDSPAFKSQQPACRPGVASGAPVSPALPQGIDFNPWR